MFESTNSPPPQQKLTPEERARRQREWEAEEVAVAKSLPSMFKPNVHHKSA